MRRHLIIVGTLGALGCPRPDPFTDEDGRNGNTDEPVVETDVRDTAPEPLCAVPEAEPNDAPDDADTLPMERDACGLFDTRVDIDRWRFEQDEDGWVRVELGGFLLGSDARPAVTVSTPDGGLVADVIASVSEPDLVLTWPGSVGPVDLAIRQAEPAEAGEGDDYFYALRASVVKAPADRDRAEVEPNDGAATAELLLTGVTPPGDPVAVLGGMDRQGDIDRFVVDVPAGRHRVVAEIHAETLGSVGDFMLRVYDDSGAQVALARDPRVGAGDDPWLEVVRREAGALHVEVVEEDGLGGPAAWYVLAVTLEAE